MPPPCLPTPDPCGVLIRFPEDWRLTKLPLNALKNLDSTAAPDGRSVVEQHCNAPRGTVRLRFFVYKGIFVVSI